MRDLLLWLYLANATVLLVHEIDSAYWHEWKLFKLPGGIGSFLLLHVPLILLVLVGLVELDRGTPAGIYLSLGLALVGVFAFLIHTYFINQGRSEFTTPWSLCILWCTLLTSLAQLGMITAALIC